MATIQANTDRAALRVKEELYNAAAESRTSGRYYLGMSEIGGPCDRALWFSFRGFPSAQIDGRVIMLFRFGDRIEEEIIYWLHQAGYQVDGQQASFSDHAGLFRGHCDGVVHGITDMPHILECKSCNKRSFDAFQRTGVRATQPKYYAQAQCYMGYAGHSRALVAIQCKDDSALYLERLYFNETGFLAMCGRAYIIITANTVPLRSFEYDSTFCQWCSYRSACWHPEETIMTRQICGNCRYLHFKGLIKMCRHPDHVVEIVQWGINCPDWVEITSKDPNTVEPVTL